MVLPAAIDMSPFQAMNRGHALTLDAKSGDFYFEYVVKEANLTNSTSNVVKFTKGPNGKYEGTLLKSNPALAQREPHGIKYEFDDKVCQTDNKETPWC